MSDSNPLDDATVKPEELSHPQVELSRSVGLFALVAFGVGDILGSGVYALVGEVAGKVGTAAWMSYAVAAVLAALTGLTYAELSSRFPKAGGAAHYTQEIFNNKFLTFLVIFFVAISGLFSFATASHTFANYAMAYQPHAPVYLKDYLLPLVYIIVVAVISARGILLSSVANLVCTVVEFSALIFIILVGIKFLGGVDYTQFEAIPSGQHFGTSGLVLSGAALAFFAFIGFEDMASLAEEAIDARRTVPRAMCLSILITTTIYLLIVLVAVSVLPIGTLRDSDVPLFDVVRQAAPWFPVQVYSIVPAFAVFNTGLLCVIMASRMIYGMARGPKGQLPAALAYVHPKYRTPVLALGVCVIIVLLMAFSTSDVGTLADGATTFILFVFVMLHIALLRAKHKNLGEEPLFRVPLILPALGSVVSLTILLSRDPKTYVVAAGLTVAAVALFAVNRFILGRTTVEAVD